MPPTDDELPSLTDEDLDEMMAGRKFSVGHDYAPEIERLVAEVRRLREEVETMRAQARVVVETERFGFTADAAVGAVTVSAFQQQELDRLRSDEWLENAADEIDDFQWDEPSVADPSGTIVAILRKHRDGKA